MLTLVRSLASSIKIKGRRKSQKQKTNRYSDLMDFNTHQWQMQYPVYPKMDPIFHLLGQLTHLEELWLKMVAPLNIPINLFNREITFLEYVLEMADNEFEYTLNGASSRIKTIIRESWNSRQLQDQVYMQNFMNQRHRLNTNQSINTKMYLPVENEFNNENVHMSLV